MEEITTKTELKKDWSLSATAFRHLLEWLDGGEDSGGERYLEMRRRLVAYFDRKNCQAPDELADETLNRVARRLFEESLQISETPAKYCYIVARFVFMENLRDTRKGHLLFDDTQSQHTLPVENDEEEKTNKEKMFACLEHCLDRLDAGHREMITRYYLGSERTKIENRRALAESLHITVNALSIRACRIRAKLEVCLRRCLEAK